jgi:predicted AAA+ superfamily ATPase
LLGPGIGNKVHIETEGILKSKKKTGSRKKTTERERGVPYGVPGGVSSTGKKPVARIKESHPSYPEIEINKEFQRALDLLQDTSKNVFITGKAGTGKSTLLEYFRQNTEKKVVVLAPTGVAALNVRGQTIHSFFKFKPDVTLDKVKKIAKSQKKNIYQAADTIVIDEISMVRADLLDCMDQFLRLNCVQGGLPFGGKQMVFIGDLYQLPSVIKGKEREIFKTRYKTGYFFSAHSFEGLPMEFIELVKIYRQKKHYEILNPIGKGGMGEVYLAHDTILDRKVAIKFLPVEMQRDPISRERFIREAKAAASLDHPFICKVYETGEVEKKAYFVLEEIRKRTTSWITGRKYPYSFSNRSSYSRRNRSK